jgi:hypothetical protein
MTAFTALYKTNLIFMMGHVLDTSRKSAHVRVLLFGLVLTAICSLFVWRRAVSLLQRSSAIRTNKPSLLGKYISGIADDHDVTSSDCVYLTAFTFVRSLRPDNISAFEHNALVSWTQLKGVCIVSIFAYVDEDSLCPRAGLHPLIQCLPTRCTHQATGLPQLHCAFQDVFAFARKQQHARYAVAFINSDIVLMPEAGLSLIAVATQLRSFVLVGQRTDVVMSEEVCAPVVDTEEWLNSVRRQAALGGRTHFDWGLDYFFFSGDRYIELPPYLIGRWRWDNWLLAEHLKIGNVVDGSSTILAIHQQTNVSVFSLHDERRGSDVNQEIAYSHGLNQHYVGMLRYTDYVIRGSACPACDIVRRPFQLGLSHLAALALQRQNRQSHRILYVVTPSSQAAVEWMAGLPAVSPPASDFVFIALTQETFESLRDQNHPVGTLWEADAAASVTQMQSSMSANNATSLVQPWVEMLSRLTVKVLFFNISVHVSLADGTRTARADYAAINNIPPACDVVLGGYLSPAVVPMVYVRPFSEKNRLLWSETPRNASVQRLCVRKCSPNPLRHIVGVMLWHAAPGIANVSMCDVPVEE